MIESVSVIVQTIDLSVTRAAEVSKDKSYLWSELVCMFVVTGE